MNRPLTRGGRTMAACAAAWLAAPAAHAQTPAVRIEAPVEMPISATGGGLQQTTAGPVQGIRALTTDSATRTATPLAELPQSVQVVPRSLIDQQRPTSQSEAMVNVSGVQPLSTMMFGGLGPRVRGFQADRFVDGLASYYDTGARDLLVNVERIEVLKGPASLFYLGGTGQIGGVVNVVSKMPTARRFAELGITFGGYRLVSPHFDVNQPLSADGTVLFRMTGQYQSTDGPARGLDQRSFAINPTLVLTNNDSTTLTLQLAVSQQRQRDYPGLPTVGTLDTSGYAAGRNLFAVSPTVQRTVSSYAALTAKLDHSFNETWSTSTVVRLSKSNIYEPGQIILSNTPDLPPSGFGIYNLLLKQKTSEVGVTTSVAARFDLGPSENRVLFAADYDSVWDQGFMDGTFDGVVDFARPVFPTFVVPPSGPFTTFTSIRNRYTQTGVAAQLQSKVWGRVHLLAGVRLANANIRSNELTTGAAFTTDQTKALPRIGLGLDVLPGLMVYGAYNEGLKAIAFFNGPVAPKAQASQQAEVGVKFQGPWGLSGTLSAYQLTLSNVPVANPGAPGTQVQTGEQQSRGFEADLVWQPAKGWSFLASYAHVAAVVTRDTALARGTPLSQVPRNSGRVWGNYAFTEGALAGLSVGAGLYAASDQVVAVGGPWKTPGYVTFDASASYQLGGWTLAVVAKNLANRQYFVPYSYFEGRVAPAMGRTVYATVSARF